MPTTILNLLNILKPKQNPTALAIDIDHNIDALIDQLKEEGINITQIMTKHGQMSLETKLIEHYFEHKYIIIIQKDKYRPNVLHCQLRDSDEQYDHTVIRYDLKQILRDNKLDKLLTN